MARTLKILAWVAAGVAAILALTLALLSASDWNRAKPWLEKRVSQATERSFAMRGDLDLSWQRPPNEQGWRRWVPWPHLRAHDVVLGNPQWASTGPEMARIAQVDFNINPFLLLSKTILVESLVMTEPRLVLETDGKENKNWVFPKKDSGSGWRFEIADVVVTRGTIRYVDAAKRADMTGRLDILQDNSMVWKLAGKYNDEKISGEAKTGALKSLQAEGEPYPIDAKVVVGDTTITAQGTLTDPAHPSALDVKLNILGASMADLFPLSGVLLPETPKFSTEGRVVGTLGRNRLRLRYENFKGKVGSSDIAGTLEYAKVNDRPVLRGEVTSNRLNLKDLSRLIGAGDDPKKQKAGEIKQPPDRILPVSPFKTDRWNKMDADVKFSGKELISSEQWPLENLQTHILMKNGVLTLAPLNFGVAGGRLTTELTIDGSKNPAHAKMSISARKLKLARLLPAVEKMRSSLGEVQGEAKLTATGNSFAAIAASANGELKALIDQGTVSEFIMEAIGLNIGRIVVNKLFGDRQVKLNCMAADFSVTDGLMQPRVFLVDTENALIHMDGSINLATERLDLTLHPESKGVRLLSLRSPIYVKGSFKKPEAGIDKGVVALKAAAATALGALATPFAALLALVQPGEQENACQVFLVEAQKKPVAPPPGKSKAAPR